MDAPFFCVWLHTPPTALECLALLGLVRVHNGARARFLSTGLYQALYTRESLQDPGSDRALGFYHDSFTQVEIAPYTTYSTYIQDENLVAARLALAWQISIFLLIPSAAPPAPWAPCSRSVVLVGAVVDMYTPWLISSIDRGCVQPPRDLRFWPHFDLAHPGLSSVRTLDLFWLWQDSGPACSYGAVSLRRLLGILRWMG